MFIIKDTLKDTSGPKDADILKLMDLILNVFYSSLSPTWKVDQSYGFGETVCLWEDRLNQNQEIRVESNDLLKILEDPSEGFYDLELVDHNIGLSFGIFDSSYLFLKSKSKNLATSVLNQYDTVEELDDN